MINPKPCGHLCCCVVRGCEQVRGDARPPELLLGMGESWTDPGKIGRDGHILGPGPMTPGARTQMGLARNQPKVDRLPEQARPCRDGGGGGWDREPGAAPPSGPLLFLQSSKPQLHSWVRPHPYSDQVCKPQVRRGQPREQHCAVFTSSVAFSEFLDCSVSPFPL